MSTNQLTAKKRFDLWNYMQAEFAKAGMTDSDFAKKATQDLGFVVTTSHVCAGREGLGIPATGTSGSDPALLRRLEAAEALLALHEKAFEGLYRHLGWRPAKEPT